MAKGVRGLILRRRHGARSLLHAGGAALLALALLPGCSDLALPSEETPAFGPEPGYNNLVANHLKATFKNHASYDAFEISAFRWVHSLKGWTWSACVRFQDRGHPRTYAVFIKDGKVVDGRYSVQTDACETQAYAPFDAMRLARPGTLEPLY